MKSILSQKLDEYSNVFLNILKKYDIKLYHVINCGLILNAFALLNLFYNEFIVFIGLFALGYFTYIIEENYENKTKFEKYYSNISLWVKLLSLYFFVSVIYFKKITPIITGIVLVLLLLCNVNYSVDHLLENKPIDTCHYLMTLPYKKWDKIKLTRASRATRNFDDNMTMLYILITICYLRLV
jgi:hypothetical protein